MLTDADRAEIIDLIRQTVNSTTKDSIKEAMEELGVGQAMQAINGSKKLTREDIMKVTSQKERQKLIAENMHLFR